MMSDSPFSLTLTVKAGGEQVVTDYCIAHLRERGYHIAAPNENWETAREFNKRLDVCAAAIHRALRREGCPNVLIHFGAGKGKEGRIMGICSNPAFEAFLKRHKQPTQKQS
jgi:hypothetical protein